MQVKLAISEKSRVHGRLKRYRKKNKHKNYQKNFVGDGKSKYSDDKQVLNLFETKDHNK